MKIRQHAIAAVGAALLLGIAGTDARAQLGPSVSARQPDRSTQGGQPSASEARDQEIHFLTSEDGLKFDEAGAALIKRAGSPDLIELSRDLPKGKGRGTSKGDVCIYAMDASDRGEAAALSRMVSVDGGMTWGRPESVGVRWADGSRIGVAGPSTVQLDDGRLRLYFMAGATGAATAPRDPWGPGEQPDLPRWPDRKQPERRDQPAPDDWKKYPEWPDRALPREAKTVSKGVWSAVSDDGVEFTVEEGVRYAQEGVSDPEVVKTPDGWLTFLGRGDEVVLAHSADGLKFERDAAFVLRGGHPAAVGAGIGRVRLYQSGRDGITSVLFDPATGMFKPEEGLRVKGPASDPAVCRVADGRYLAVVTRPMERSSR